MNEYRIKYTEVYSRLSSHWGWVLTPSQLDIMHFVNNRTYRYGKSAECIPIKHFLEGVKDSEGVGICAPIRCRRRTFFDDVYCLVEQYKILFKINRGRNLSAKYGINYDQLMEDSVMPIMPIGKKIRKSRYPNALSVVPKCTPSGSHLPPKIEDIEIEDNKRPAKKISRGSRGSLKDRIEDHTREVRSKESASADEVNRKLTKKTLEKAWRVQMLKHYSGTPFVPASFKNWIKVRGSINSIKLPDGVHLYDILSWSIENWKLLGKRYFTWLNDPLPPVPELDIWCVLYRHFVKCYANAALKEFAKETTSQDSTRKTKREEKLEKENAALKQQMRSLVKNLGRTDTDDRGSYDELPEWSDR